MDRKLELPGPRDGLTTGWQFAVYALVTLALFSRGPGFLTHAQFYAEDGAIWFAQAYNGGWLHSLTVPQAGYLNTIPRLAAGLALLAPFRWAPLVMATTGLLIQGLPVPILLSPRSRNWGGLRFRLLLCALYIALPNTREIHVVATNAQWHLALAALLLAFASAPRTWRGYVVDVVVQLTAALSGPFCIVLAPLVLIFWWVRRQPWSLAMGALVTMGAATQVAVLLNSTHRVQGTLGATPAKFVRMLGGDIVACALLGSHAFADRSPMLLIMAAALIGLGVCLYCLRFANLEWRLFLVYCAALYAASLRSPLVVPAKPAWDLLVNDYSGRYWFFPMLGFVLSAAWCALHGHDRLFKIAGTCVLISMPIGVIHDWKYRPYPDAHFAVSVQRMLHAMPGDRISMPIAPDGWSMELVKKGR